MTRKHWLLGEKRGQHSFPISITNQAMYVPLLLKVLVLMAVVYQLLKQTKRCYGRRREDICILKRQCEFPFGVPDSRAPPSPPIPAGEAAQSPVSLDSLLLF